MTKSASQRWDEVRAAGDSVALQIELLVAFVRDFPESYTAWSQLGIRLSDVSRYPEAERALHRAKDLSPPKYHRLVYLFLGQHYLDRGHFHEAERWYRKSICEDQKEAGGYIYLGSMFARLGRLDDAERQHRRATACKTGCIDEAYHNLGLVLRAQQRYQEAIECFDRAVAMDPDYDEARQASRDAAEAMRVRAGQVE